MISRYTSVLLSLLVAVTTASPHGVRDDEPVDLHPGKTIAAYEALDRLLARQESCGILQIRCGNGCMPSIGSCCAPEGNYFCEVMQYCTLGGCCPVGLVCTGSATTTITESRTIGGDGIYTEPSAYPTPSESIGMPSNSMSAPPIMTEPSGPGASPSSTPAIPSQTSSFSSSMEPSVGGSSSPGPAESSSSEIVTSSPPQESSSQPSSSVPLATTNAASPRDIDMGRAAALAGLAVGVWGL